jgi:hypothetical protein
MEPAKPAQTAGPRPVVAAPDAAPAAKSTPPAAPATGGGKVS